MCREISTPSDPVSIGMDQFKTYVFFHFVFMLERSQNKFKKNVLPIQKKWGQKGLNNNRTKNNYSSSDSEVFGWVLNQWNKELWLSFL